MNVLDAIQQARKEDIQDRYLYQQKATKSNKPVNALKLPKAWTSEIRNEREIFVHKASGIKVYHPSHMRRILELVKKGTSIIEAKQIVKEERRRK